jgi:hypothetical protein
MLHLWLSGQDNRLAANKQSSAVPNMTAVTVMFNKLAKAVENTSVK